MIEPRPATSSARRDFMISLGAALGLFLLFLWFDVNEAWHDWVHANEAWEADELPMVLAAAGLCFAWFGYRRWREFRVAAAQAAALNRELTREIERRAEVEQALRDGEQRFKDFSKISSDWIWEMDAELRFNFVSSRFFEVAGIRPDQILGKTRDEFARASREHPAWAAHVADLESRRPFRDFEHAVSRPDGQRVHVSISGRPLFDAEGNFIGYRGTGRNITRRKRAEKRLRASEARYRKLYNGTPVMLHSVDREGRLLSVSDYWLQHLGYSREEVLGRRAVDFMTEESRRYAEEEAEPAFMETGHCEDVEYQFVAKNGAILDVLLSATAERDSQGMVGRSLAVLIDVTELKRSKAALEAAKEEAELANRAKSDFLANMSHELRTPLNAVIGFAEIIRDQRLGPVGHPDYADFAGEIDRAGQHLLALIGDLLDLAKIEAGKAMLREDSHDLARLVEASVTLVRQRALSAGLTLAVELDPDLPPLWADGRMVKQVLLNLLSNAVKFTDPGGVVTVTAGVMPDGGLHLAVSDTGVGMDPEEVEQAMVRFGQVDRHQRRGHQGSGLGLPLALSLAELHGGTLDLASERGRGTTATLVLPAWRLEAPRATSPRRSLAAGT